MIFICKSTYPVIKDSLIKRGWVENEDYYSSCFDIKWTCKSTEAYYTKLLDN
jgi:hypothetical protein